MSKYQSNYIAKVPNDSAGNLIISELKKYLNKKSYCLKIRGSKPKVKGSHNNSPSIPIKDSQELRIYVMTKDADVVGIDQVKCNKDLSNRNYELDKEIRELKNTITQLEESQITSDHHKDIQFNDAVSCGRSLKNQVNDLIEMNSIQLQTIEEIGRENNRLKAELKEFKSNAILDDVRRGLQSMFKDINCKPDSFFIIADFCVEYIVDNKLKVSELNRALTAYLEKR